MLLIINHAQEIDLDLGQLIADNSLAFAILILVFLIFWKVLLPFWTDRENKREEFRIKQEEAREKERIAREERYLRQQEENIKMLAGFRDTIQQGNSEREQSNKALIENLGKISKQLDKQTQHLEKLTKDG